jgi:hypothetical protein
MRYWDGRQWTGHVSDDGDAYEEVYLGPDRVRWQYGVVNIGMFNAMSRMANVLAASGEFGWELVGVYDKASNWMNNMEKGFMLFKRPIPPGVRLAESDWCVTLSDTTSFTKR